MIAADLLQRLKVAAVVEPRVAGPDPADAVWLHIVIQKPHARVDSGLSGAQHRIGGGRLPRPRQIVDGTNRASEATSNGIVWVAGIDASR